MTAVVPGRILCIMGIWGDQSVRLAHEPWRWRVVHQGSRLLALFAVAWFLLFTFRPENRLVAPYMAVCALVLIPPALPWFSRMARVVLLLVGLTVVTAISAWAGGPAPGGFLAALVCTLVAGVVFGVRAALFAWLVSGIAWGAGLWALNIFPGPFSLQWLDPTVGSNVFRLATTYLALSSFMAVGLSVVFNQMGSSLREAERARVEAEAAGRQREQALNQLIEAQKFQVMAQLSGGVAHDMNNFLQVLLAYCEILESSDCDAGTASSIAGEMRDVCDEASKLARQLLALGKRVVLVRTAVDLGKHVALTTNAVRKIMPADVRMEVECATGLFASVDTLQLKQTLLNLALNAGHAMPRGGTLRVVLAPLGETRASIVVEDTGTGMDDSTQERIFEPFFTTKGNAGTGLGLPTAKAIIEQHGGRLEVWSRKGEGTRFTIILPLCASVEEVVSGSHRLRSLRGIKALVVDDDTRVRAAICTMLRATGAEVESARDVEEALAVLETSPYPHVLCTDAVMPGRPAKDLLDNYRRLVPDGGIVICSAYVESELMRRGIQDKSYFYLAKPFASRTLVNKVLEALGGTPEERRVAPNPVV